MTVEKRIRKLREQLKDELFLAPKVTRALLDVVEAAAAVIRSFDDDPIEAGDFYDLLGRQRAALARFAGEPEA